MTRITCGPDLADLFPTEVFRALSDPSRVQLVAQLALSDEARTVSEASSCCGVHLSGVSRHLSLLRQAGLVESEKEGREVRYRLRRDHLVKLLRDLANLLEQNDCCSPTRTPRTEP